MSQEDINLTLEARQVTGKSVKHLRKAGIVPAVIHDHGKDSLVVQADAVQILKVWRLAGKHHPVQLKAEGKSYTALIKTADFDPKKHQLRHIVFNAVNANEKVEAEVPVHPQYDEGNEASPAERAGLMVLSQLDSVLVEAVASKLPDVLYYNAEKLVDVGDHASVADLVVPEGVIIKTEDSHAIATVFEPSALQAANEAAGGDAEAEIPDEAGSEETTAGTEEAKPEASDSASSEGPKSE